MYYFIYQITNKVTGKIYIGAHKTHDLMDSYMGSSRLVKSAIKKYGVGSFTKEILEFCIDEEEMFSREKSIVNDEFIKRRDVYNLKVGGDGGWQFVHKHKLNHGFAGKQHTKKTKDRLRFTSSERQISNFTRTKMSENNFSKRNPDKQREHARLAAIRTNETRTEETISKISSSVKEHWLSIAKVTCPHCQKTGRGGTMKRWHFDNCKNGL